MLQVGMRFAGEAGKFLSSQLAVYLAPGGRDLIASISSSLATIGGFLGSGYGIGYWMEFEPSFQEHYGISKLTEWKHFNEPSKWYP